MMGWFMSKEQLKTADFDYQLPDGLIAKRPVSRGGSKLLVLEKSTGRILDRLYGEMVDFMAAGDLLVLNDTKVFKSRLMTTKSSGAKREVLLLEKHHRQYQQQPGQHQHRAICKGKVSLGEYLLVDGSSDCRLKVEEVLGQGLVIVSSQQNLASVTKRFGTVPLPPYMHRLATCEDEKNYQTVFAKNQGSVAAPTASLNMTKELLTKLSQKGVLVRYITLHVGLGTFLPIRTKRLAEHKMHSEYFSIPAGTAKAIKQTKANDKQVVALGTTVARTLEYAKEKISRGEAQSGEADIFIYPGYKFSVVDKLVTNFHAPKSTVLMLAAGFAGSEKLRAAYEHAKENNYRFLSYGDSMMIV
jgi:S-adenosylmethionine:tRNA ribosyltransferase-isomerase